ncbi:Rieske 2Fe-2S domain-containing protein [Microcoleus sp. S13_C5]|uniref:Rieske 2Fe-2S domain-containing protein n=1 Tax=Microcoleus sp. S13_C5 TaxID=3055411 RepID=UPI002FD6BAA2
MQFAYFWYIVALSDHLQPNTVLARSLDGEGLAIFRGEDGQAAALRDRPPYSKPHKQEILYCIAALQP